MSSSSSNSNKCFRTATLFTWFNKDWQVFCTVVLKRIKQFKVYTLNKRMIFNFFLHKVIQWVRVLIKSLNFVKIWLGGFNFEPIVFRLWFSVSEEPTNDIKTQFIVEINLFIVLVRVKCIRFHYTDFSPKQWIRHRFLKDEFSKSNQTYSTKSQKVRTKTQKPGTGLSQTGPRICLLLVVLNHILPTILLSSWSITCPVLSMSSTKNLE